MNRDLIPTRMADAAQYAPLLAAMDEFLARQGHVRVAIDGRAASGKSTLAALLEARYDANVFHMDDYFLRPEQRTPQRYEEPGGNVDYERFAEEVLAGLDSGLPFTYRPFDTAIWQVGAPVTVEPKPVNVVEGSYSLHPTLRAGYDIKVFLDISPETQSQRVLKRNGEAKHRQFLEKWIPLEEKYFGAFHVREACDMVFETK